MPAAVGQVWTDPQYYRHPETGDWERKQFLILGIGAGYITSRLLTSQQHGRPEDPACYHDETYAAFYLGVIDAKCVHLCLPTWLDLRYLDDTDDRHFAVQERNKAIELIGRIDPPTLCLALSCAANAPATRPPQRNRMMDARQAFGCR